MYYRPEQWDKLDKKTLDYLDAKGLRPIYDHIISRMTAMWKMLDAEGIDLTSGEEYDDRNHPKNFYYEAAWAQQRECFGMYNALLIFANNDGRKDIAHDIYSWGHYGLFY